MKIDLCVLPVFWVKQILMGFLVNIIVSHHFISLINPTACNSEVSNEELKQQLREALEVSNCAKYAALEICISF